MATPARGPPASTAHELDPEYTVRDLLEKPPGGFGRVLDALLAMSEEEKVRLWDAWRETFIPFGAAGGDLGPEEEGWLRVLIAKSDAQALAYAAEWKDPARKASTLRVLSELAAEANEEQLRSYREKVGASRSTA